MIRSYVISVRLQGGIGQELYVRSESADLRRLLQALDESPTVTEVAVTETLTIPDLTKFGRVSRDKLGIENKDMPKVV